MKLNIASVTLTAGDGNVSTMNGLLEDEQLQDLRDLEKAFPKLIVITDVLAPVSIDLLDYTKLWLCGKDDEIHEKLYDLNIEEFSAAIRDEDIHQPSECPVTV